MRAVEIAAFGGPEHLRLIDLPTPEIGPGQVLVEVEAAGVGMGDVMLRRSGHPGREAGMVPGFEVAGTVLAVGSDVDAAWLGRRVFSLVGTGGYCEHVAIDVDALARLPATISAAQAVALGVNALVAAFGLRHHARLIAGERVLVRGAAGGIGMMATQIAALDGATVAVTTSSADRGQRLRALGASEVLDRSGATSDFAPDDFDVIVDPVWGPDMVTFLGKLRPEGRMVMCGVVGGFPEPDYGAGLFALFARSPALHMCSLHSVDGARRVAAMEGVLALAARRELQPIVHAIVPFEDAAAAHEMVESGRVFGKVVLTPSSPTAADGR